jgi:hypothetical protein
MRFASLEELAERWSIAHTIALSAWVVALVLGVTLLIRNSADTYPVTDMYKVYAAENATFTYPANWTINRCSPDKSFIEVPGTIKSDYKGRNAYLLTIYGDVVYECMENRPARLDIRSEKLVASNDPCAPATSTEGEDLGNGLYLQLQETDEEVYALHIKQNSCYAPADTVVLGFAFLDPNAEPDDSAEHGPPRVKKEAFLKSRQFQDIRALAQSIRY